MIERISRSWQLAKASAAVLRADKELLVFPIVSGVLCLLVAVTFALPMVFVDLFESTLDTGVPVLGWVLVFLFYVVQYFVIFFCNTALVGAALIRLRGGDPTVADGFRIAGSRIGAIAGYALVAATVGMVLRAISERSGFIGRIVVSLVGLAWNLATYLVVPVLVVEGVGPIEAVKRSASYLRKTWGEQIAGNLGMGLVFGVLAFATLVVGAFLFVLAAMAESALLMILVGGLVVLALIANALVGSALGGVYAAAVYRYAAEGDTGTFFTPDMVRNAFQPK
jgi:hypothetical protein